MANSILPESLNVQVVYALSDEQHVADVRIKPGVNVREVIEASGLLEKYPQIDLARNMIGIFSKRACLETKVYGGERIEIYRPLAIDPKQRRRLRARAQKNARN